MTSNDPSTHHVTVEETRSPSPTPAADDTANPPRAVESEDTDLHPQISTADPRPPPSIEQQEADTTFVGSGSDPKPSASAAPKVCINLLLVSGRRRTLDFDPKTTVGQLKEVVWSTWPSEWSDELPPSAAFLRILHLGRVLPDDTSLSSLNLPPPPDATVVHVSVRTFVTMTSDEDLKKPKKRSSRRSRPSGPEAVADAGGHEPTGASRSGCCGGCIIV